MEFWASDLLPNCLRVDDLALQMRAKAEGRGGMIMYSAKDLLNRQVRLDLRLAPPSLHSAESGAWFWGKASRGHPSVAKRRLRSSSLERPLGLSSMLRVSRCSQSST